MPPLLARAAQATAFFVKGGDDGSIHSFGDAVFGSGDPKLEVVQGLLATGWISSRPGCPPAPAGLYWPSPSLRIEHLPPAWAGPGFQWSGLARSAEISLILRLWYLG